MVIIGLGRAALVDVQIAHAIFFHAKLVIGKYTMIVAAPVMSRNFF
jgi:hypothetical protein